MTTPPVLFSSKIKATASGGGYPVQISAGDLDKNFVFGLLEAPALDDSGNPQPFLISEKAGAGGHQQRQLIFNPPPPRDGQTYRLSFTGGAWGWEKPVLPDGTAPGQFIKWDSGKQEWVPFSGSKEGAFPQWDETNGWESQGAGTKKGQFLKWDEVVKNWVPFSGASEGDLLQWDEINGWESQGAGTKKGQFLKWDEVVKNWVPFSGASEGDLLQWDEINGWESQGAGTVEGQLLKWDNIAKNWVPGPVGNVNNELLRWNIDNEAWESFGRGATDGQLLVAESGGWIPFTAPTSEKTVLTANGGNLSWESAIPEPPSSGTYVLGAVGGSLTWIGTEECE
jgi:hypothetical protein